MCEEQHRSHRANHFQKHIWINHRGLCAHSHSWEPFLRPEPASTHTGAVLCPPFPHLSSLASGGMDSLGHRLMEGAARARQEASGSGAVSCTQPHPAAASRLQQRLSTLPLHRLPWGDTHGFHFLNAVIIISWEGSWRRGWLNWGCFSGKLLS